MLKTTRTDRLSEGSLFSWLQWALRCFWPDREQTMAVGGSLTGEWSRACLFPLAPLHRRRCCPPGPACQRPRGCSVCCCFVEGKEGQGPFCSNALHSWPPLKYTEFRLLRACTENHKPKKKDQNLFLLGKQTLNISDNLMDEIRGNKDARLHPLDLCNGLSTVSEREPGTGPTP